MNLKKQSVEKSTARFSHKSIFEFVGNVKAEMKKISWTPKSDLFAYAKIVIVLTCVFGITIYFMDIILHSMIQNIGLIVKAIIG